MSLSVRAGFTVIVAGGLVPAALVLALPRLTRMTKLLRFRLVRWLRPRATCVRDASHAWGLVSISWLIRTVVLFLLLHTFGVATSLPLAIMYLCAGAASAAIPIGPAEPQRKSRPAQRSSSWQAPPSFSPPSRGGLPSASAPPSLFAEIPW